MRTAAAWCLLLPSAAAFAPAPPPDSRRRALTTRSAGAGELLAEVRDLARLRPTRDDIVRLSDACDAGDGALRFLRRRAMQNSWVEHKLLLTEPDKARAGTETHGGPVSRSVAI